MSVNWITIKDGAKIARPVLTAEEFRALRNNPKQIEFLKKARSGDDNAKRKLVQFNYSGHYPKGVLKGNTLVSNVFGIDVDSPEEFERIVSLLIDEEGKPTALAVYLAVKMIETSVNHGGHIFFGRELGKTILENQVRVAKELDCEIDTNAHDVNRVFFATSAEPEDLIYLSDDLFEDVYDEEAVARESALLQERERNGLEVLPAGAHNGNKHYKPGAASTTENSASTYTDGQVATKQKPSAQKAEHHNLGIDISTIGTYKGIPYEKIIKKYWELYNDGNEPCEGDRNVKTFELAMALRPICDFNLETMMRHIPRYDGLPEDEWRKTLESALNEPRKGMPWRTRQVLKALQGDKCISYTGGTRTSMPKPPLRLPKALRVLLCKVKPYWKYRYAPSLFSSLASHLHDVQFRYWDGVLHCPTFESVLCAEQSVGKGRINDIIDKILADIKAADQPNRLREAEYKRKNPIGKTKARDPRPTDLLIRILINNLTDAVFNQRVVDADQNGKHFIYTRVDELEALKNVTSKGTTNEVSLLIRSAFDNADHGQERVGSESVSGIAPLRWNWNASTTPGRLRSFFKGYISDGTITRLDLNLMLIDKDDPNYVPPIVGIYDDEYAQAIKPFIDNLNNASGIIECPQATRLSLKLKKEYEEMAELMGSKAFGILAYRANVLAFLRGMVLYIAQGYKWDRDIENYVRWSMQQDMFSKMVMWGETLDSEMAEEEKILKHSGPQNLLDLLEDEFSKEEYQQMRASQGKTGDGESTLRTWIARGHIVWDEIVGKYVKTEAYKDRNKT